MNKYGLHIILLLINISLIIVVGFVFVIRAQKNNHPVQTCLEAGCHDTMMKPEVKHPPMVDDCKTCHESIKENHPKAEGKEFKLTGEVPDLCYGCHEKKNPEKHIHPPYESGNCLICHSPHSSSTPKLINAQSVGAVCDPCHDLEKKKKKSSHKPVLDEKCEQCHDPHQSSQNRLLKTIEPDLCLNCHTKLVKEKENKSVHPPFTQECSTCHRAHYSSQRYLLRSTLPQMCFKCHAKMQADIEQKAVVHKAIQEKKSCLSCHTAHSSTFASLLSKEEEKICFQCHGIGTRTLDSLVINISEKVRNSKYVHEPVKSGCNACHLPHASDNQNLLTKKIPGGNYCKPQLDLFTLCFDCHSNEFLEKPTGQKISGFMNAEKNLHYLHVMKEKAMNCINCHDVHGSNNKHLIADKIRFNKFEMSLNYTITEHGGSCRPACHSEKKYSR